MNPLTIYHTAPAPKQSLGLQNAPHNWLRRVRNEAKLSIRAEGNAVTCVTLSGLWFEFIAKALNKTSLNPIKTELKYPRF